MNGMNDKNENSNRDLIDRLYDENDCGTIVLFSEKGEEVAFEQIAVIPHDGRDYAILQPVILMEGMDEDEAILFEAVPDENGGHLSVVTDDAVIDAVFAIYDRLIDELDSEDEAE